MNLNQSELASFEKGFSASVLVNPRMKAAVFSPSNDASTTPNVVHVRKDVPLPKYGHWSKVLRSVDPEQRFHGNQHCLQVRRKCVLGAILRRRLVL